MDRVSIRDLRNHGGEVVGRAERGEILCITRDGRGVAELHPLSNPRLTLPALLARYRDLSAMDPAALRSDIDQILDTTV